MIQNASPLAHLAEIDQQLPMYLRRFGPAGQEALTVAELNKALAYQPGFLKMLLDAFFALPQQQPALIDNHFYPDLIRYLKESHAYYNQVAFPQINRLLESILLQDDPAAPAALIGQTFIQHYAHQMALHFEEEEKTLFPLVLQLVAEPAHCRFSDLKHDGLVSFFENQHQSLHQEWQRVQQVLLSWRPNERNYSPMHGVITFMTVLQRDIQLHEWIEDELLLPFVSHALKARRRMPVI